MTLLSFADYIPAPESFLVEGLVCRRITVLSGKPKSGKSALAGHICQAVLTGAPILDRQAEKIARVAWVGTDGGWMGELHDRWGSTEWFAKVSYIEEPARAWTDEAWTLNGTDFVNAGCGLVVVDNLYGLSSGVNLDRPLELKPLVDRFHGWTDLGLPVLLVAHAGKGYSGEDGSAAHSYGIEADARHLLKLKKTGDSRPRQLTISGNYVPESKLSIRLTPYECALTSNDSKDADERQRERSAERLVRLHQLVAAPPAERKNQTAAGRWLANNGYAASGEAGRTQVKNALKGGLLVESDGVLVAGPKLQGVEP